MALRTEGLKKGKSSMATAMLDIETLGQGSNAFILQICIKLIDKSDTLTLNIDPWRVQVGV